MFHKDDLLIGNTKARNASVEILLKIVRVVETFLIGGAILMIYVSTLEIIENKVETDYCLNFSLVFHGSYNK